MPDRAQRTAELIYIALLLGIAGLIWREARTLPPAPYDPLGPGSFPLWVAYGLAGLALAMLLRLALGRSLGRASHSMVTGLEGEAEHETSPATAILLLAVSFGYAIALSLRAPFLFSTMAYLFAGGAILGPLEKRRLAIVAVFAVVAGLALDTLFLRVFHLDLN
jgi:hypothetical protein